MAKIRNYADAVYHVKRGFLVIGLTGRTGSGCSTALRLLTRPEKPKIPGYDAISSGEPPVRDERIYAKLKREWESLNWDRFVPIEVSKLIFALTVDRALRSRRKTETLEVIRRITATDKQRFFALRYLRKPHKLNKKTSGGLIKAYELCRSLYITFKKKTGKDLGDFIELMQNLGDEIRKFGWVSPSKDMKPSPENLFILPEAIRRVIKAYRIAENASHFVIDAFRNPYEVEFFKWRYSEFYLVAILRDVKERYGGLRSLTENSLKKLENREAGGAIERRRDNIADWITSQDLEACFQKGDMFVKNVMDSTKTYPHLRFNLIKLITLVKNPGCVPPTTDERCMQIAMTARQMSGCIARQVGAAVVNKDRYCVGVGWNESPQGQVSCSLRTGKELVDSPSKEIFSDFERSAKFVKHIRENCYTDRPFCFRSELPLALGRPGDKMAEFTRALHAEENALSQATRNTGRTLDEGVLYTTASTCTLCAKKAYQLGISRIVYIEEYSGIGVEQTIKTGDRQIEISRFQGVTGSAYFQLFGSLMPEKDLIRLYL